MSYPLPDTPTALPSPAVDWRRRLRGVVRALAVLSLLALCATTALALIGGAYRARRLPPSTQDPGAGAAKKASVAVQAVHPKGVYVVIDTFRNHLRIYKD